MKNKELIMLVNLKKHNALASLNASLFLKIHLEYNF